MPAPGHEPIHHTPSATTPASTAVPDESAEFEAVPEVVVRARPARDAAPPLVAGYRSPAELWRERRAGAATGDLEAHTGLQPRPPVRDAAEGSFGSSSLLEVVIGNDDRIALDDDHVRTDPWRRICALRITASSGMAYVGTAWFIGRAVLATAGHCVFLREDGGWAAKIDVIPGLAGEVEPFGRATAIGYASVAGWRDTGDRDFDYGVIFLDSPDLGDRLGCFALGAAPDGDLSGAIGRISGYPSDLEGATRQYYHERPLGRVTATRLTYDIDTFGGQSGSPIWLQSSDRDAVAVGIHTTGTATGNSGTRISEAVLGNLVAWAGRMGG